MDQTAIIVLISLFPLWLISLYLFSRASWSKLSRKYKSTKEFYGNNYGKLYARINDLNYGGRLYLQYNEEGINLSVVKRYRPFHPPVFIPWNDIVEINKLEENVVIVVGNEPEESKIQVSNKTYEKLEQTLTLYKEQVRASF